MTSTDQKRNARRLFNVSLDSLNPGKPPKALLEQYKLYLEYLDRLADRRQSANSFFLTLNTGLCTALAFLFAKEAALEIKQLYIIIPAAGILLSFFWHRLVTSYRQLSTGKFEVIHRMERYLPMAPYKAEWDMLGSGIEPAKYQPLTKIEVWVPRLFIIMYIAILFYIAPWAKIGEMMQKL